jgi:flagellar basal-body rod modification protein FlgD
MEALDSIGVDSLREAQSQRQAASNETGQADFLQMLVAQLQNQDPLNPQDSADFAAQLAQFSTVEQLIAVRQGVDALVASAGEGGGADRRLDPTQLVGRDVLVAGRQFEVDGAGSLVPLQFRTTSAASAIAIEIYDENGDRVFSDSLLPVDASGERVQLNPDVHAYDLDPREIGLPPGIYAVDFKALGPNGGEVAAMPILEARVTGAILGDEPSIRVGQRIFPVADVLEVLTPGSASGVSP